MINCLISNADNEFVTIYEIKETIVNGASVIKPKLKKRKSLCFNAVHYINS